MTKWLRQRLHERSTMNGTVILSVVLGFWLGPGQADIAISALSMLYGVYEAARNEGIPHV